MLIMTKIIKHTWSTFDNAISKNTIGLLPIGSIEQHGLHAPIGTDLIIATAIAEEFEDKRDILLLPSIPIGVSIYHNDFPGTLWVSPDTLRNYINDIVNSLFSNGLQRIIIVNGHGGNIEPINELCMNVNNSFDNELVQWTWFRAIEKEIIKIFGYLPPLHADEVETSLILFLMPELVKTNQIVNSELNGSKQWGIFFGNTQISKRVELFSKSGSTGFPTNASFQIGEELFNAAKLSLEQLINFIQKGHIA